MYRGLTVVLDYNSTIYEPILKEILKEENSKNYWNIDVNNYNEDTIEKLNKLKSKIEIWLKRQKLTRKDKTQKIDLLTTKIMLEVFGNTPTFDNYVTNVIRTYDDKKTSKRGIIQITT